MEQAVSKCGVFRGLLAGAGAGGLALLAISALRGQGRAAFAADTRGPGRALAPGEVFHFPPREGNARLEAKWASLERDAEELRDYIRVYQRAGWHRQAADARKRLKAVEAEIDVAVAKFDESLAWLRANGEA